MYGRGWRLSIEAQRAFAENRRGHAPIATRTSRPGEDIPEARGAAGNAPRHGRGARRRSRIHDGC
jgi:hypothetical protein